MADTNRRWALPTLVTSSSGPEASTRRIVERRGVSVDNGRRFRRGCGPTRVVRHERGCAPSRCRSPRMPRTPRSTAAARRVSGAGHAGDARRCAACPARTPAHDTGRNNMFMDSTDCACTALRSGSSPSTNARSSSRCTNVWFWYFCKRPGRLLAISSRSIGEEHVNRETAFGCHQGRDEHQVSHSIAQ